jgi:hypothetical protein
MLPKVSAPVGSYAQPNASRPDDSVNDGNLPVILQAAMRQDIELSPPGQRDNIIARVAALNTRSDAATYLASVAAKRNAARAASATAGGNL